MTRRFALALIVLVIAQFCVLYAWQRYERNDELQEITAGLMVTNRMAIANQEELLAMEIMNFEELMQDDTKARFWPLSRFVIKYHGGYQALYANEDTHTSSDKIVMFIKSVATDFKEMLLENYKDADLKQDAAVAKCAKIDDLTADALSNIAKISSDFNPVLRKHMARIITLDYVQHALMEVMVVCGGKSTIIDQFFPVFNADRCAYQAGDTLSARVSVGSYSSALDPKNVVLTIDGKEYPIGPDGTAKFQTSERKRGQHTLKTKVVVTNPLTGRVQSGEGSYTYEVY